MPLHDDKGVVVPFVSKPLLSLRRAISSAVRQFWSIEAQRVAERRSAQLAAIVPASSDAIISVGTDLSVHTWNAGAQRLFGYSEAEARGRAITELKQTEAEYAGPIPDSGRADGLTDGQPGRCGAGSTSGPRKTI